MAVNAIFLKLPTNDLTKNLFELVKLISLKDEKPWFSCINLVV